MESELGEIGINLLVAVVTAAVTGSITWRVAQRSWRHRERYDAVIGVLREARSSAALTNEWRRLRGRKDDFAARVHQLRRRPRGDYELSEAQRRLHVAEDKLTKVNDRILDAAVGVHESSVKLDLLNRGSLASLAENVSLAHAKLNAARTDDDDIDSARTEVESAEKAFLNLARRQLRSGRSAR